MSAFSVMLERHNGAPTVSLFWIGRTLGHRRKGDASLIAFVDLLIERLGFPQPLPHYRNGGGLETGVTARSEWLRAGVEAWLEDNFLPPSAAASLDREAEAEAAAAMDAAAHNLRLVASNDQVAASSSRQAVGQQGVTA